jgi:uncharacterized protein YyaL (SSP411 family)
MERGRTVGGALAAVLALAAVSVALLPLFEGEPMTTESEPTPSADTAQPAWGRNRLAGEKSPYLLQHADNPVHWFPWGSEAFEEARRRDKPVFISIGYSTCHWCHVMAHESFEDPEVARYLNETFVCIKVDREERPDIDAVYMAVCQMMTGSGGWPLTIITTPDKKPFFAATYLPPRTRMGRIGVVELAGEIRELWSARREELEQSAEQMTRHLARFAEQPGGALLDASVLDEAFEVLEARFDPRRGGFGTAPKFPSAHNLTFLLRYGHRTGRDSAVEMVETTLRAMRRGGIWDHVGFGWHRYSTDAEWLVPHFEKMLYDQAMIVLALTETWQASGAELYERTVRETVTYVLRDLRDGAGGFYSAEDADSEGVEGKFYVWTEEEIREAVGDESEAGLAIRAFGVRPRGNFHDEASGQATRTNILHLPRPEETLARELEIDLAELRRRHEAIRRKLFEWREQRVRPHRDDKVLTDWNGLMIAALARAARVFDEPQWERAAAKAADFVLECMRRPDGRLLHRWREGEAGIDAHLDDYAFLVWGLIELYQTSFDPRRLRQAVELTDLMTRDFADEEDGGFYFTADDAEKLLVRRKEIYDGAVPSGNSVAFVDLLMLARLTGRTDYEERAAALERAFSPQVEAAPFGYCHFLTAADYRLGPASEVVIAAESEKAARALLGPLRRAFVPRKVVLLRTTGGQGDALAEIAPFTKTMRPLDGRTAAYVCTNFACAEPTAEVDRMLELLGAAGVAPTDFPPEAGPDGPEMGDGRPAR